MPRPEDATPTSQPAPMSPEAQALYRLGWEPKPGDMVWYRGAQYWRRARVLEIREEDGFGPYRIRAAATSQDNESYSWDTGTWAEHLRPR